MGIENSKAPISEDFLDSLTKNAPLGFISVNDSGIITLVNRLAKVLLQVNPINKKLIGQSILDCVDHIPLLHEKLSRFLDRNWKSFNTDLLNLNDQYISVKGVSIKSGFICIINDFTRMKEIETESIQSIIAGQENERRRIGREIHDGIGPLLSYSKLELDAFLDEYVEQNNDIPDEKLVNIRNTLDSITNDLRNLSHHLMPRLLEEFGLYSAFNSLTIRLNNSIKSKVEFYCNIDSEDRFDGDLELNLYRCGQELINNAVKHAKASEILVQVIKHEHSIILMVEDDGIGFEQNVKNMDNYGIGLTNIETRVRTFDGTFIIESLENKGTTASIEIPLK